MVRGGGFASYKYFYYAPIAVYRPSGSVPPLPSTPSVFRAKIAQFYSSLSLLDFSF